MKIYFAGEIRGGREDSALYLELVELLRPYGTVLTEHIADEQLTSLGESMDDRAIHDRDLAWLKEADCLVAEVTTPSLGVGFEIGKATEWGLWVLCLFRPNTGRTLSALIGGSDRLTVREYQDACQVKKIFDEFFTWPGASN
ncbi:MAG TPA: nucleoside 2-deoxyribosyltransferase [Pyrinomonadaceae bacterium]|nr:nucleoside 2-deoxyribosyltransferase [Pyrinomonadaceae bacterium]